MKYYFGLIGVLLATSVHAAPVDGAFIYQGQLVKDGTPVSALQDFKFGLYDAAASGAQMGTTVTLESVPVEKGLFNVPLNFGASAFGANARFLQVEVKPTGQLGFASLAPRIPITPAPVALTAVSAITADTATTATFAAPSSIGSTALQTGAVGWGQLSPALFPKCVAVLTSDRTLGLADKSQLPFSHQVLSSDAITLSNGIFTVSQKGLYRIDLSLTVSIARDDTFTCDMNVNYGNQISFRRQSRFINTGSADSSWMSNRFTVSDYVSLNSGNTFSIGVESRSSASKILGFSSYRYSYISIARVK